MNVVALRVKGFNKRKDYYFANTDAASKFQKCLEEYDKEIKFSFEVLSAEIDNTVANIRELGRKPEAYAEKAFKELKRKK